MKVINIIKAQRKGQAATEYLLMLAIVLVVILTSAIFFTNIPSLVSQMSSSGHRDFWYYSDIGIRSHSLYSDGTLVLNIKNNKAAPITIDNVWLNSDSFTVSSQLNPSEKKIIKINMNKNFNPGEPYSFNIGFTYSVVGQQFEYKPDVPITGTVQE
ncbi:hypothetical protein J7J90_01310 [Candidatus Micrarchaeota archaeon]|nr:hypothetical protein [Candidatus Micrarchaeota archaeon]